MNCTLRTLSTVILGLLASGPASIAWSQNQAFKGPAWNGGRTALTEMEKLGVYLSFGTMTCHKPASDGKPEQYFHGTGQITMAKDVVTTAAHIFINPLTCQPYTADWSCEFRMESGRSYAINMEESRFGTSMKPEAWETQKPGRCKTEKSEFVKNDWAVIKLKTAVQDATPYSVSAIDSASYRGGVVTEIAGYTQAYLKDGKETPTKERCHLEGKSPVGGTPALPLVLSSCGGGPGTSGSGLFMGGQDAEPGSSQLVAVYHGPLVGHGKRTSIYVPVAGDFLRQLKEVAAKH
ncbi:MAG TPA: hypothetical protein VE079_21420 [Ensifer sp.]|nr:hypothetical protein [Ensifer sp.]